MPLNSPDGGKISLYAKTLASTDKHGERLYIAVSDSGTGILKDLEKHFQTLLPGTPIFSSLCMDKVNRIGLYLCKQLTERLKGEIRAKNNRKQGCTFRLLLPTHKTNPHPFTAEPKGPQKIKEEQHTQPRLNKKPLGKNRMTFLVVEDNPDMKNYICSILSTNTVRSVPTTEKRPWKY